MNVDRKTKVIGLVLIALTVLATAASFLPSHVPQGALYYVEKGASGYELLREETRGGEPAVIRSSGYWLQLIENGEDPSGVYTARVEADRKVLTVDSLTGAVGEWDITGLSENAEFLAFYGDWLYYLSESENGRPVLGMRDRDGQDIVLRQDATGYSSFTVSYGGILAAVKEQSGMTQPDPSANYFVTRTTRTVCLLYDGGEEEIGEGTAPVWLGEDTLCFLRGGELWQYSVGEEILRPMESAKGVVTLKKNNWNGKGLCFSPDGKYLVYLMDRGNTALGRSAGLCPVIVDLDSGNQWTMRGRQPRLDTSEGTPVLRFHPGTPG